MAHQLPTEKHIHGASCGSATELARHLRESHQDAPVSVLFNIRNSKQVLVIIHNREHNVLDKVDTGDHALEAEELYVVVVTGEEDGPVVACVPGWGAESNTFADLEAAQDVAKQVANDRGLRVGERGRQDVRVFKLVEMRA